MSAPGFTPISLYYSTTASAAPSAGNLANGELALNITDGKLYYKDNGGLVTLLASAAGASGDVVGPASSTDNALVRFDTTTGKLVQNSVGVLSDAGVLTGLTGLTSSGSITFSSLTSGRVPYATTAGLLTDSANLLFDGTTLTANALTVTNAVTLSGGVANGVAYLNGSKVLTTGSALTFDGTNLGVGIAPVSGYKAAINGDIWQGNTGGTIIGSIINNGGWYEIAGSANVNGLQFAHTATQRWMLSGSEQMRLTSTGLGIGTSSPAAKLELNDGSYYARFSPGSDASFLVNGTTGLSINSAAAGSSIRLRVAGADRATLDSSGNLGLGVTPYVWNSGYRALDISAYAAIAGRTATNSLEILTNSYRNSSGTYIYKNNGTAQYIEAANGAFAFYTAPSGTAGNAISFTQAMTLDSSGNLLVGRTSASLSNGTGVSLYGSGIIAVERAGVAGYFNLTSGTGGLVEFRQANNTVGSISVTGSATSYNTSSDYRLKQDIQPMTGALAKVAALKPVTYKWKSNGKQAEGFIAHELAEVCPDAVTGEKDAVDAEGKPVYQGIDTSFLVATLTAAIQELKASLDEVKLEFDAYKATHP